jgi:hypothetical protein
VDHDFARGTIAVRHDHDMCADLTLWNRILALFLTTYQRSWLRLGLETVLATTISETTTLKHFFIKRVLSDDKVLGKYTDGKCNVPSGPFEKSIGPNSVGSCCTDC